MNDIKNGFMPGPYAIIDKRMLESSYLTADDIRVYGIIQLAWLKRTLVVFDFGEYVGFDFDSAVGRVQESVDMDIDDIEASVTRLSADGWISAIDFTPEMRGEK